MSQVNLSVSNIGKNRHILIGVGEVTCSEFIPVIPGSTYTFGAYVKGDLDREVYILVLPINAHADDMEASVTDISFNNMDWRHADLVLAAPSNAIAVKLDLGPNNTSDTATAGMICYDDVSFR